MIGLAKACNGGGTLANYVMDESKGYELDRNMLCGSTPKEMVEEMKMIQDLNQRATNKTFSIVLSPDIKDGKNLSDDELKTITRDYLNKLGIDTEKQQFVAFVHTEKEHKHIHIIANRVQSNGKLISDHHIGKRAQWIAHEIAKEKGLVSAKEKMFENIKSIEKEKSDLKDIKAEIYKKHQEVLKQNPGSFENYIKEMNLKGLEVRPTINKQGQIQGFRILDKQTSNNFKASEIHRSMSGSSLIKSGLKNDLNHNLDTTLRRVQIKQTGKIPVNRHLQRSIQKGLKTEVRQLSNHSIRSVSKVLGKEKLTSSEFKFLEDVTKPIAQIEMKNIETYRLESIEKDNKRVKDLERNEKPKEANNKNRDLEL